MLPNSGFPNAEIVSAVTDISMDVNVPPVMVVYASALEVFRNRGRLQFKCSAVKCLPVDPTLEEDAVVAVVVEEIREKSSASFSHHLVVADLAITAALLIPRFDIEGVGSLLGLLCVFA